MNVNEYIKLWTLNKNDESVAISHSKLISEFGSINNQVKAQDAINYLRSENLICCDVSGKYLLTNRAVRIRKLLPRTPEIVPEKKESLNPTRWHRFRKLLSYYMDCVHIQERSQEYLHDKDLYRKFFLPIMPYNWLKSLDEENEEISLTIGSKAKFVSKLLLHRADEDEEIYLGYPLIGIKNKDNSGYSYTPISLIPVDIKDHSETTLKIKLRFDETEINQAWVDFNVPEDYKRDIANILYNFSTEGDKKGLLDLRKALPYLSNFTKDKKTNLTVDFDPNECLKVLPENFDKAKAINAPLLFVGNSLKYSKTLKKELAYIRDKVDNETLDETALAYIFRDPPKSCDKKDNTYVPLSFIDSNDEQRYAISEALNTPISKVTGPPGTGKSQVAVNIIANLIYEGKNVLFSSMNHKAVNAIAERSVSLLEKYNIDIVKFCSNEDNSVQNPWFKQNIEDLISRAKNAKRHTDSESVEYINDYSKEIERLLRRLKSFNETLEISSKYSEAYHRLYKKLKRLFKHRDIDFNLDIKALKNAHKHLKDDVLFKFSLSHILNYIIWRLCHKKHSQKAREVIFSKLDFLDRDLPAIELKEDLLDILDALTDFKGNEKLSEKILKDISILPDSSEYAKDLKENLDILDKHIINALAYKLSDKVCSLGESLQEQQELKGIMATLKESKSPYFFQKIDKSSCEEALRGFKIFSKYFPAWATTLLSLTKASPCIAGLFDRVIIDEASQCIIPPVIPALFRAKALTVIGDPNQFPPVVTIKPIRHDYLKSKYGISDLASQSFDFMAYSAYDIVHKSPIMLKEHFRCNDDIVDFINEEFYSKELRFRTNKSQLRFPKALGYKNAIEWANIENDNEAEVKEVIDRVKRLVEINYEGSVGIISPHKKNVGVLETALYEYKAKLDITINTANGFQGGECDLVIFMLGYNDSLTKGGRWYAGSTDNRYIYNVALSRARAFLLIVGDRNACEKSGVSVLESLAKYPKVSTKKAAEVFKMNAIEEKFYNAILASGIDVKPQYPVLGRRLDFAIIDDKNKIDIEIDGKQYHINSDGNRKYDDLFRDLQLESAGWKVIRFWAAEVNKDIDKCIEKVRSAIM
ncbi:MAG: AAA domain-containing protein [Opitutales bacterium]